MAETPKRKASRRRGGTRVRETSSTTSEPLATGRVDHPAGKFELWIDKDDSTEEMATGRVDHPAGKFELWIDQDEPTTATNTTTTTSSPSVIITDNVTLTTYYSVKVTDPGPDEEKVKTMMFGSDPRRNGNLRVARLLPTEREAKNLISQLIAAGAKYRVGKFFSISSECPLKDGKVDDGNKSFSYSVEVTSLGRFSSKVLDLLLGSNRNPNLQINLPYKLSYDGAQREEAVALVEQLTSLGAKVTMTQFASIDLPLA